MALMAAAVAVVLEVFGQDTVQVSWAGDEHAVGAFGPHGAHEALGVRVHPRGLRRGLDHVDPDRGEDGVERVGELRVAVPDQVCEPVPRLVELPGQFPGELGAQAAVGCSVIPSRCTRRVSSSMTNATYSRVSVTAQSTWKKSVASKVVAWARRKVRHVSSWCAGGGIRCERRILRMVEAATRCPSRRSSPWMRTTPHRGFSRARRRMSAISPTEDGDLVSEREYLRVLRSL